MKAIDLRSDTVTRPTQRMREAIFAAEVGDDCYGEDPTVNELEAYAAQRVGKEAAVYFPTGTMGNTAAIMAHTQPADLVLLDVECHIYYFEHGNLSSLGGVMPILSDTPDGCPEFNFALSYLARDPKRFPRMSLICLENTHNRRGGRPMSVERMAALREATQPYGARIHLDGARVFNAAHALGVDVCEITAQVDSVMFCLSKGLCAPVGSMLAGSAEFAAQARRIRKRLGGAMRQAGVMAAAGLVALREMTGRLPEDHAKAQQIAQTLAEFEPLGADPTQVKTNIVILSTQALQVDATTVAEILKAEGLLVSVYGSQTVRLVTHHDASDTDVATACGILREQLAKLLAA